MLSSSSAAFRIEQEILFGGFRPGDRLESERTLAGRYNAGRGQVREAIARLTTLGLLQTEPQSGSYVQDYLSNPSYELMLYLFSRHGAYHETVIDALCGLLRLLEITAAEEAAESGRCAETAAELSLVTAEMEHESDPAALAELDFRYHAAVIAQSENMLFSSLFHRGEVFRRSCMEQVFSDSGFSRELLWLHSRLETAIEERNGVLAVRAMDKILAYSRSKLVVPKKRGRGMIALADDLCCLPVVKLVQLGKDVSLHRSPVFTRKRP